MFATFPLTLVKKTFKLQRIGRENGQIREDKFEFFGGFRFQLENFLILMYTQTKHNGIYVNACMHVHTLT